MFDGLFKHGCIPNKSLILKFPENLDPLFYNHFIRGYFDGDGSVFITKNKVNYQNHVAIYQSGGISICGTIEFLTVLKTIFSSFIKCNVYKERRRITNTWALRADSNKTILAFYNYLYKDAKTFLQRKKNKFEQIINERGSTTIIGTPTRTPSHLMRKKNKE